MPESDDLALLVAAAEAAGGIAKRHFGREPRVWDKGQGQGPVSQADLEIDEMLRERLRRARPEYGWLSEESAEAQGTGGRRFIIDPIDGTRAYLDGQSGFAHALAVVEQGMPVAAVIYLPLRDLCYTAARGAGAFRNDEVISVSQRAQVTGADLLVARPQLAPEYWPGGVPNVTRHFRPSLAWRMALVAEGQFDAMLTLRPTWHWDSVAGTLLIAEAGGVVSDGSGAALRFDTPEPRSAGVIAAGPVMHAELMRRRVGAHVAKGG
ncbi:MAG: 3'(2'),5'-bisphosphate nucleotidase CysQ [Rhodobacteraceae bacterium]|nr:MAG: 3'(2'),5'-bisphosphate nucleotidase CysQ [Paracoccaceae bacterium]